ncbi:uncharacterized protein MKZ38_004660 [Zalerion maritima]|uniref:Uncharacterized protein n=1 Tax=Zalerion maritima TaxID=339359 RepID=A0AAD5WQT5_9PEZI|nr:uncharacterized protein MKZ38_004660 [Zalerion maritima]
MSDHHDNEGLIRRLSMEATGAAALVGVGLRGKPASSVEANGIKVYPTQVLKDLSSETDALVKESKILKDKPIDHDSRITAVHFESQIELSVAEGETMNIIPVHYKDGTEPQVGGESIMPGNYAHLESGTRVSVEPDFHAVIVVSRLD